MKAATHFCRALAATLLATAPLCGQEPAPTPLDAEPVVFAETLDVNLLQLDVAVLDRDGAPVRGLSAGDFEVRLDKKKAKISTFSESSRDEPLVLLVLADGNTLRSANLSRTLEGMREDLSAVLANDDVAVRLVAYDLDGAPDLYVDLRSSGDLEWAIKRLAEAKTLADRRASLEFGAQSTLDETLRQLRGNARDRRIAVASLDSLVGELGTRAAGQQEIAARSLAHLQALIRSLATTEGRKAILLLTDGIPVRPLDTVLNTIQSVMTGGTSRDDDPVLSAEGQVNTGNTQLGDGVLVERDPSHSLLRLQQAIDEHNSMPLFDGLVADANVYRIAIVPVLGLPGDAAAADARAQARGSESEITDLREPLNQLAERTGGIASTSGNAVRGLLAQAVDTVEHSYALGLEPPKGLEVAEVKVKVKAKAARILAPSSVTLKQQPERLADRTMGGLALAHDRNPHKVDLQIEPGEPESDAMVPVNVIVSFPIELIGLNDVDGTHRADAQAAVAVVDPQMRVLAAQHVAVPLVIPNADLEVARGKSFGAYIKFRLPPGDHRIGLTLWDAVANRSSFVTRTFTVDG